MKRSSATLAVALAFWTLGPAADARGQEPEPAHEASREAAEQPRGFWHSVAESLPAGLAEQGPRVANRGRLGRTADGIGRLWAGGRHDLYLAGYAWHAPWRYSSEILAELNQETWGFGYGRTLEDPRGRMRMVFVAASVDSYDRFQYMAGYGWRAIWRPRGGPIRLGGGYLAMLIGRYEFLRYTPLPVVVPAGSVGTAHFEVMGTYLPVAEAVFVFVRVGL